MAEEGEEQDVEFTDAEGEGAGAAPGGRRKLIIMVVAGLVGVIAIGVIGYFLYSMMSGGGQTVRTDEAVEKQIAKLPSVYFDLPEMVVNLSVNDKRAQYLKIKIALEAHEQAAIDALQPVMPRVLDMFQIYLRELRSSDLEGSAGIFRLKEELLRRINLAIYPNRVNRVLFKEIIIQ